MSDSLSREDDIAAVSAVYSAVQSAVAEVVIGNEQVVEGLTIALLTRGHILLEGVPGVAKTTIAKAFSRGLGTQYTRIQMTPDLLPADITGSYVYREATSEFELQRGPIFSNIVVADEINRATPKTQSALLEAMQERQVTLEGDTFGLPDPFFVIATQNPIEMEGTFELAEAQRDRFLLKHVVAPPNREEETQMIKRFNTDPTLDPDSITEEVDIDTLLVAREEVTDVFVSEPIREYILDIVHATRSHSGLEYGSSPRATLAFLDGSKARAAMQDRAYVLPGDIKTLVKPVLRHRLIRTTDAQLSDRSVLDIIDEIVESVPTPGSEASFQTSDSHDN